MAIILFIITLISIILALIIIFLIFYKFYFLRNPKRVIPVGNNIISPADGKIVRILEINTNKNPLIKIDKGILGKVKAAAQDVDKNCYLIHIMLTPFDVHYQRAPISGKILSKAYTKGKFMNAVNNAKSLRCFENENEQILIQGKIKNKTIKVKVILIAGALAKRIVSFVKEKQEIKKGQIISVIKLGSQVSIILPKSCRLKIKEGQYVYGGSTIIADVT